MSLSEKLADPEKRAPLIDDCVTLVDSEVGKKSGLGGVVIKTGYKAVKGIKPGFVRNVIDKLFDEWAKKLDPIWEEGVASGSPRKHFEAQRARVANELLSVTDSKAENADSGMVRSTYKKLRPTATKHVEEAVPALGGLLEKHSA